MRCSMNKLKKRKVEDDAPIKKKKRVVEEEAPKKKKKRVTEEVDPPKKKKGKSFDLEPVKKRKVTEDEPKKLSKKTELALARISKLDEEGRNSIMGSEAETIQQLLESGQNDGAMTLIHKRMLQALMDLLPHAENNVRATKGQKGVYQINSLITSVRELLSDLQATKDRGAIGISLVEKVVRPAFLDIGMSLVQEEQRFATVIQDLVPPELFRKLRDEHRACVGRIGHVMNGKYEEVKQGTINHLQS